MQLKPITNPAGRGDPRSDYQFDRVGEVMIVVDNDRGRSVTTDAVNVVEDLVRSGNLRPGDRLMYRDTMGYWDELVHHDGRFINFAPIRTQILGDALERMTERQHLLAHPVGHRMP